MTYPHNPNDSRGRGSYPDDRRGGPPNGNDDRGAPRGRQGGDDDDDGPLMAEGDYPLVAVAHKWGYSSKGGEQIGVRVRFVDGPYKGRTATWYGHFSDAAMDITIRALRALGMKGDDLRDLSGMYANDVVPAIGVVQHDNYEGKVRARVAFINGSDVAMKEEMSKSQLDAFAQRMRGAFSRSGGGGGSSNRQPSNGGGQRDQRDDRGRQGNFEDQRRGGGRGGPPVDDRPPPGDDDMPWTERDRGRR